VETRPADPIITALRLALAEIAARRAVEKAQRLRGMLSSPLYAGRLPDGSEAHWPAVVPRETWDDVQAVRETRRTRDGRPATHRVYALSMLRCAACSRRLIGDTGRYRHTDPCEAFVGAYHRPRRAIPGQHRRTPGHSYQAAEYEHVVRGVLERVALGAETIAEVMDGASVPQVDRLALARIERERSELLARYRRDRDGARLEAEMARLDEAERTVRTDTDHAFSMPPTEAVAYLRDLPTLWDDAPESRRALAESLFDRVEVLGLASMHVEPTPAAVQRGLAEAFSSVGAGYGRGERSGAHANQVLIPRLRGGTIQVTMGGERAPLRAVRSA
jgi:hypothetical protein